MNAITSLVVKVSGQITESNFDSWKVDLINRIKASNRHLSTDDDFVDAQDTVKDFKNAENELVETKARALQEAADIQQLFDAIDEISGETRQARLSLEKQIKVRKEQLKSELVEKYFDLADGYYNRLEDERKDFLSIAWKAFHKSDFVDSIKGKKTIKSMESALQSTLDQIQANIDEVEEMVDKNAQLIDSIATDHMALFQDRKSLLAMSSDVVESTIEKRIAVFEAEELRRIEAQRLEREAKKAEEQRITDEKAIEEKRISDQAAANASELTTKSRLPVADAQDTAREPDPTGGGGQDNQGLKTDPKPQAVSANEPAYESFQIIIEVTASVERVTELAKSIDKQYESDSCVSMVRLKRAEAA